MDLLQASLIFLILLLSIFLTITGIQVFFILRDLKKALDKLNGVLQTSKNIAHDIEKPITAASNLVSSGTKALKGMVKRKPATKRFYRRGL